MTSLYVMSVPSGFVKVGIAEDPAFRREALQTGNPELIRLEYAGDVGYDGVDAREMEREMERDMHRMLGSYRVRGEWFQAPVSLVYHVFKIAWMHALYPALAERWERLCARPVFSARHAAVLSHKKGLPVLRSAGRAPADVPAAETANKAAVAPPCGESPEPAQSRADPVEAVVAPVQEEPQAEPGGGLETSPGPAPSEAPPGEDRRARYRRLHPEWYRAYMQRYMAKRRGKE